MLSAVCNLLPRSSTNKQTNINTSLQLFIVGLWRRLPKILHPDSERSLWYMWIPGQKKTGACWKTFLCQRLHRFQSLTSVFVQVLDMLSFCRYTSLSFTPFPKWTPQLTYLAGAESIWDCQSPVQGENTLLPALERIWQHWPFFLP